MSDTGTVRGNPVARAGTGWVWADTGEPAEHWDEHGTWRPCIQCGRTPQPCEHGCQRRHDPCLGHIDGAASACCGHGIHQGYVLWPSQTIDPPAGWHANVHLAPPSPDRPTP